MWYRCSGGTRCRSGWGSPSSGTWSGGEYGGGSWKRREIRRIYQQRYVTTKTSPPVISFCCHADAGPNSNFREKPVFREKQASQPGCPASLPDSISWLSDLEQSSRGLSRPKPTSPITPSRPTWLLPQPLSGPWRLTSQAWASSWSTST